MFCSLLASTSKIKLHNYNNMYQYVERTKWLLKKVKNRKYIKPFLKHNL